jgi:DNA polymerase-3 subunit gamma/tau
VSLKTPRLSELVGAAKPGRNGGTSVTEIVEPQTAEPAEKELTDEAVQEAWKSFAETRRRNAAEYQLLSQPFDRRDNEIIVHLHNPVQETILNTLRSDLTAFLRTRLQNRSVNITGELKEIDTGKLLYTNKEKFDYLVEKYPILKELKERLGLDPDF